MITPVLSLVTTVVLVAVVMGNSPTSAADPSPTPLEVVSGDVRSADAPGVTGGPLEILLLVIILTWVVLALFVFFIVYLAQYLTGVQPSSAQMK